MAKTKETLMKELAEAQVALTNACAASTLERDSVRAQITPERVTAIEAVAEVRRQHDAVVNKLTSDVKSKESSSDTWYRKHQELTAELAMVHLVLDTLPGAPPRELKAKPDDYAATQLTVVARLAGYLAVRP